MMENLEPVTCGWILATVVIVCMSLVAVLSVLNVYLMRRRCALALQAERDERTAFFEAAPTGMVVFDQKGNILRVNAAVAALAEEDASRLAGKKIGAALRCAHRSENEHGCGFGAHCGACALARLIASVSADGQSVRNAEVSLLLERDGKRQTVWLQCGAAAFAVGGERHVIAALTDVTADRRNQEMAGRAEAELARVNQEAQEARREKGRFLASLSHEIRTPLNGIIGMTDLLGKTPLNSEQRDYVETIRGSGEALTAVCDDMLDYSRIEADQMVLEHRSFDLQHCLEEVIRLMAPAAAKKKLELTCRVDKAVRSVWLGDAGRLSQVLGTLIGNSIKFTERGEVAVSVTGEQLGDKQFRLVFAVRDTGVGFPPEQRDKLFASASPGAEDDGAPGAGVGLGLELCKRLCEMMGGTLTAESKGLPGQGSVFRFTVRVQGDANTKTPSSGIANAVLASKRVLIVDDHATSRETLGELAAGFGMAPVLAESGSGALDVLRGQQPLDVALVDAEMPDMSGLALAAAIGALPGRSALRLILLMPFGGTAPAGADALFAASLCKPVTVAGLHDALVAALTAGRAETSGATPVPGPASAESSGRPPALRILVAEDNALNQKVAVSVLKKIGYEVDVAADGSAVMEALGKASYDVIFMDVQMPELDGEQTTIRIRKELPAERQPWIVAMTAHALKGDRERYLSVGMNDYLAKPVRTERLLEVLKAAQPLSARRPAAAADAAQSAERQT